jgi:hypothetical protein
MIVFSLHNTTKYLIDNQRVFDLLAELIAETDINFYIQRFYDSKDGRGAWRALKLNAEGPERCRILQTVAQTAADTTQYNGGVKSTTKAYNHVH